MKNSSGATVICRAWGNAYYDTMNLLHELLQLERLDREFLLKAMFNIARSKSVVTSGSDADASAGKGNPHKPDHTQRRGGLSETELKSSIKDFIQKQNRLADLDADPTDKGKGKGGKVVIEMEDPGPPGGYEPDMVLSKKAMNRLMNRRPSVPATLYLETQKGTKHKIHGRYILLEPCIISC